MSDDPANSRDRSRSRLGLTRELQQERTDDHHADTQFGSDSVFLNLRP